MKNLLDSIMLRLGYVPKELACKHKAPVLITDTKIMSTMKYDKRYSPVGEMFIPFLSKQICEHMTITSKRGLDVTFVTCTLKVIPN